MAPTSIFTWRAATSTRIADRGVGWGPGKVAEVGGRGQCNRGGGEGGTDKSGLRRGTHGGRGREEEHD